MSLLQQLVGNATEATPEEIMQKVSGILIPNEQVVKGYNLLRDSIIFTNERLIIIDVQGLSGNKKSFTSYPYSSVKWYSMESAGTFDLDAEIKLGVQELTLPLSLKFKKGTDLNPVYQLLSVYILRDN